MHVVELKLPLSSSHLQCTPLSFLSLRDPANLLQLLIERRIFFTAEENVENGVLLDCLAIFQQTFQGNVS